MSSSALFHLDSSKFAHDPSLQLHRCLLEKKQCLRETLAKGGTQFINSQDSTYSLTPLALAVIQKDLESVQTLLRNGANPAFTDGQGWSSLHFAVVNDSADIEHELQSADRTHKCGLQSLKNNNGATPQDLREQQKPHFPDPNAYVFSYRNADGNVVRGTSLDFKQLTSVPYSDSIVVTPRKQAQLWSSPYFNAKNDKYEESLQRYLKAQYLKYQEKPPSIYVDKDLTGLGLYAGETITAGQVICHFSGKRSTAPTSPDNRRFKLYDLNADAFRNLASLANDGYPNAFGYDITHFQGYDRVSILWALDEIKEGEQILWDYVGHEVKRGFHLELNLKKTIEFFKNNSFESLKIGLTNALTSKEDFNIEQHITEMKISSSIFYLLNTPIATIYLIFNAIISCEQIEEICRFIQDRGATQFLLFPMLHSIKEVHEITKTLDQKYSSFGTEFRKIILNTTKEYPYLMAFHCVFLYIRYEFSHKNINPDNAERIIDSILALRDFVGKHHSNIKSLEEFKKYWFAEYPEKLPKQFIEQITYQFPSG